MFPIFLTFLVTHALLIAGSLILHFGAAGEVTRHVVDSVKSNAADPRIGVFGLLGVFLYAYSMGAGTYTGIEAVSNSMPVMREPRVATAKKTMVYMAISLAFTAGGLMVAYLLLGIRPEILAQFHRASLPSGPIVLRPPSWQSPSAWRQTVSPPAPSRP